MTAIADVRSVPFSRRFPWFSSRTLAERLHSKGIAYVMVGDTLGGRPANPALYRDGIADYEAMAGTAEFRAGLDRVIAEMGQHRLCLMCSEREPLDCHRCLLVGRVTGTARLCDRPYSGRRLDRAPFRHRRAPPGRPAARGRRDLFGDRESRLAEAYRRRARRIAARLSDRVRPGRVPRAMSSSS